MPSSAGATSGHRVHRAGSTNPPLGSRGAGTSQTSFAARFYATVGPIFTPYQSGFEGQIGGEFIAFPQRWLGLGLASQFELAVLDSAEIDSLHLGAVLHFRF